MGKSQCGSCGQTDGRHFASCTTQKLKPTDRNSPKKVTSERMDRKKR